MEVLTDDNRLQSRCSLSNTSGHAGSDDEGPFRFDCNALEVQLSPRSRQRETSNTAADEEFNSLLAEASLVLDFVSNSVRAELCDA